MDFVIDLSHFTVPSDEPTNHDNSTSQFSIRATNSTCLHKRAGLPPVEGVQVSTFDDT